jgi:hypothetical protein
MNEVVRPPARARAVRSAVVVCALLLSGCSTSFLKPTPTPGGDEAPVTLRDLQIENADGHRAVLLRLSRVPSSVRHSSSSNPAQITVQAWGPVGEGDLAERDLPQVDDEITQVRVSRRAGGLSVVLDLKGDQPPSYTVHEMADWIMIRFGTPQS